MNWFLKQSQVPTLPEVQILSTNNEEIIVSINGTRYRCPQIKPTSLKLLRMYIRQGQWGNAKNLLRSWPCFNIEKEKQDFQNNKQQPRLF